MISNIEKFQKLNLLNESQTSKYWLYNNNYTKPNSKKAFLEEGSNLQVISLASEKPKFIFHDKTFEKNFNNFLFKNSFLTVNQKLEKELYKNGLMAVGFNLTNNKLVPRIQIAKILDYSYDANLDLEYLKIVVDTKKGTFGENYFIIEEYDLRKTQNYITTYAISSIDFKYSLRNKVDKNYYPKINNLNYIPFVIFANKWDYKSDIDNVPSEFFETLDSCYQLLLLEGFFTSPIYTINNNFGGAKSEATEKALFDLSARVLKTSSSSQFNISEPLNIFQGTSQAVNIIQKIESLKYWIKDALFFKKTSGDNGTKNMHTAEALQLNSNFENYIEAKANLREETFLKFVELYSKFTNQLLDLSKTEIIVVGSTKWQEIEATKIKTNQDGAIKNPNQFLKETSYE